MPTEQQPEEAATRPLAAAASAAGSFTQTQMYGRGFRQQPSDTRGKPARSKQQPVQQRPSPRLSAPEAVPEQAAGTTEPADMPPAGDQPGPDVNSPDRPAAGAVDQDPAAQLVEPEVSAACSGQDAAAAAARLAQGQRVDIAPVAPAVPGVAPGL